MDIKKFYGNIRYLLSENHIKVSDFEHAIGHPVGYISRLEYKGSLPRFDSALKMAEVLGVTIEQLANGSFDEMSATDTYLLRFLNKLVAETEQNSIKWKQCVRGFAADVEGARISICQDTKNVITVAIEISDGLRQEICSTYRQNEISDTVKRLWGDISKDLREIKVPNDVKNVIDNFMIFSKEEIANAEY